jgi:hypothetical protein
MNIDYRSSALVLRPENHTRRRVKQEQQQQQQQQGSFSTVTVPTVTTIHSQPIHICTAEITNNHNKCKNEAASSSLSALRCKLLTLRVLHTTTCRFRWEGQRRWITTWFLFQVILTILTTCTCYSSSNDRSSSESNSFHYCYALSSSSLPSKSQQFQIQQQQQDRTLKIAFVTGNAMKVRATRWL